MTLEAEPPEPVSLPVPSTLWFHQEKVEKKEMGGDGKVFTFEEVTVHNNHKDCWLIINGKVRSFIEFSCFSLQRFVLSCSFVDFMV